MWPFKRKKPRSVIIGSISNVTGGTLYITPGNINKTTVIVQKQKKSKKKS